MTKNKLKAGGLAMSKPNSLGDIFGQGCWCFLTATNYIQAFLGSLKVIGNKGNKGRKIVLQQASGTQILLLLSILNVLWNPITVDQ